MSSVRAYAGCGLVLLLAVAGCSSGGDDPPVTSSTTPVTSTTSEPTRSSPPTAAVDSYPAAALAHTVEGGQAFVEYYYAQLNAVLRHPATGVLPALAADVCEFCKRIEKLVGQLVSGVDHYDSDPIRLVDLAPMPGAPKNQQYYSATSVQVGAWIVDNSGKKLAPDKLVRRSISIAVVWGNGGWRLYGADRA